MNGPGETVTFLRASSKNSQDPSSDCSMSEERDPWGEP
jgi:hypothetical protein